MNYFDLGYNKFLQKASLIPREYLSNSASDRVGYASTTPSADAYKAVVSANKGDGTFLSIQEAIDEVNDFGGGEVFLKNGTYTLNNDLTLYSKFLLSVNHSGVWSLFSPVLTALKGQAAASIQQARCPLLKVQQH